MAYTIRFEDKAIEDIERLVKSGNKAIISKLEKLLIEISEHPRTGTGQIEHLRYFKNTETWSRRLSHEHRLVYHINEECIEILIVSACGHYK